MCGTLAFSFPTSCSLDSTRIANYILRCRRQDVENLTRLRDGRTWQGHAGSMACGCGTRPAHLRIFQPSASRRTRHDALRRLLSVFRIYHSIQLLLPCHACVILRPHVHVLPWCKALLIHTYQQRHKDNIRAQSRTTTGGSTVRSCDHKEHLIEERKQQNTVCRITASPRDLEA